MDSDNNEVIYCPEDDENRVFCNVCDKLRIERFYKKTILSHKLKQIILVKVNNQIHTSDVIFLT